MGIKIFDLPPNGLKDGAVAVANEEQSIETPNEVISNNIEKDGDNIKVTKFNADEVGPAVRGEVITEQVSPEDPPVRKYVQYDDQDRVVSSDPEGSEEFANAVGEQGQGGVKASMKTKMALHMLRVELPLEVVDEINSHIDETIPGSKFNKGIDLKKAIISLVSNNKPSETASALVTSKAKHTALLAALPRP